MTRLVIVADDLTGAADSAAPMVRAGATSVVLEHDAEWPGDEVVAVDTDSRHCPPAVAAARAGAAAERARCLGARVYKKLDSTLRGNVGAELRAIAGALGRDGCRPMVVVAAAFPATGRTTVGGVVHVDGEPLDDGDLAGLLRRDGLCTAGIGLERLGDAATLAATFDRAHAEGVDAVVVDAADEEHLAVVVAAADRARRPLLLAGSGGLARPLAASLGRAGGPAPSYHRAPGRPELVVVGSHAPASRAQRERLAPHARLVVLTDSLDDTVAQVRAALLRGPVVLSPDPDLPVVLGRATEVARRLAGAAAAALDRAGTLVVTGGETARAVLTAAGVGRLAVLGEPAPGVVRSHVPALGLDVVTKAGAFGEPDTLLRCLAGQPQPESEGVRP